MSRLPTLTTRKLVAALKRAGYYKDRPQSGSHLVLKHPTRRQVIVPVHTRDLKRALVKDIIKQAELTEDEFRDLL